MATAIEQNELVFEFANNGMEDTQELGSSCIFPAVIVEQVPNADLLQEYSGLACDEETNGMINDSSLDVVEEQVIGEDITLSVEASCQNGDETMETIEAAEALLNMDSPGPAFEEKRITRVFMPSASGMVTAPVTHISVRADGVPEVVENAQEIILMQEAAHQDDGSESLEQTKKRKGRKPKARRPVSPVTNPDFPVKRKSKDGKGNTIYLWEFLLALLQDKSTCPRYIKWTQREKGIFKLVDSKAVSRLWGKHKNKPDMNYETMGRALRTIKVSSQVPVVVSPGTQRVGTVTLQTVPLTTVITSTDLAMSSPKFVFQTVPSSHPVTVLKENVALQGGSLSAKIVTPTSLAVRGTSEQQVLPTSPQVLNNGTQAMSSSTAISAATPVVTFAATSQQVVSQPQGTVFASVIKAPETKQAVASQECQEEAAGTSQQGEHTSQQSHVIVLTNAGMLPSHMVFRAGEHRVVDIQ
ncbi:ETS-related transcription factor Elf-1-like isoform X4 [Carcharodon carcharias]|uniref:ETS-related transcription factor Elf-1-like isoform X4 n=1 Tax=Carcharodon carcharias TaxID=13397 RepID=UPI001B7ED61D|nr:ETS-related transcription factor Elf-1-like isoform X4 [Carcharodon carcharias]